MPSTKPTGVRNEPFSHKQPRIVAMQNACLGVIWFTPEIRRDAPCPTPQQLAFARPKPR